MKSYLQTRVDGFHTRMGMEGPARPRELTATEREIHARVAIEEYAELAIALVGYEQADMMWRDALNKCSAKRGQKPGNLPEIVKECIDCEFVSAGVLWRAGVDDLSHLQAVCDSNDAKVGGGQDEHGKWRKPRGWLAPDIEEILIEQGYKP